MLVVDDDRAVRDSLKFSLELEGFQVETYASGSQLFCNGALAGADCLVLDLKMPGMDGFGVMSQLHARLVVIPVILITAPVTEALRARARDAGMFQVLEKPLLGGALQDNIRQALGA
ncbi:MAG TPA: response regulator [Rhizomicrobium sp.]|nr:response regulator [Rhizomicrobium sp.]